MYYKINAVVLKSVVSKEADKLVTIYSREFGKMTAIVPGAKKIKAKHGAASEPVVECEFQMYAVSDAARPKITGARIKNQFLPLRCDWKRYCAALGCAEILDHLTPYNLENAHKYDLLIKTWNLLASSVRPQRIFLAYILRFLKLSGYSYTEYLRNEQSFLSDGEKLLIRKLASLPGSEVDALDISEDIERKAGMRIEEYLGTHLNRPLEILRFWSKLKLLNRPTKVFSVHYS